ncbi:unnamed protein product [Phaedon cochleariae]|uniref:Uncharacterized protein n=1 Tax=Phaedon cochleariae TaxID=80249 RepID=A0A9P0DP89_PHACE|nr:unnamed protein product [Phaedon cochleariae]
MLVNVVSLILFSGIYSLPSGELRGVAESNRFDDFDNYLPKYDDFPNFDFSSNDLEDEIISLNDSNKENDNVKNTTIFPSIMKNATTDSPPANITDSAKFNNGTSIEDVELVFNFTTITNSSNRLPRQELNETEDDPEFTSEEKQSQESSEEEDGNMITGLISAFLGGLSKPDGGIDLDAIVGLLGSLSTQNPDGTYDFQGLTELLRGLIGGGGDEGGGSDIGAFVGGLLGAVIKGVANPPGPKGAGILTGKIFTGLLPALSGPVDTDTMNSTKQDGLESGSFLSGLLKPILASSGGQDGGIKGSIIGLISNLVKFLIRSVTKLISASSSKGH